VKKEDKSENKKINTRSLQDIVASMNQLKKKIDSKNKEKEFKKKYTK
jgi:hypothetical protein